MSDSSIVTREGIKVEIAGREYEIKPFVINARIKFTKLLFKVLAESFLQANKESKGDKTKLSFAILGALGADIVEIYDFLLEDRDLDWIQDNLTMKDEVNLIEAVIKVNDFDFLVQKVQPLIQKIKESQWVSSQLLQE